MEFIGSVWTVVMTVAHKVLSNAVTITTGKLVAGAHRRNGGNRAILFIRSVAAVIASVTDVRQLNAPTIVAMELPRLAGTVGLVGTIRTVSEPVAFLEDFNTLSAGALKLVRSARCDETVDFVGSIFTVGISIALLIDVKTICAISTPELRL